jgi:hypothetical protein
MVEAHRVPPLRTRSWNDVLDNLGENLIRLGTSLTVLAETPANPTNDGAYVESLEQIATGFRLAFRQAKPALASGEVAFVQLTRGSVDELAATQATQVGEPTARAQTLVHEGMLICQEMVGMLNLIEQGARSEPERTRQTFVSAVRSLAEITASAGWELRTVCHEYEAENRLLEPVAGRSREPVVASLGLLHDMAGAAQSLRLARREWFRVGQRLSSALGNEATPPAPPPEQHG